MALASRPMVTLEAITPPRRQPTPCTIVPSQEIFWWKNWGEEENWWQEPFFSRGGAQGESELVLSSGNFLTLGTWHASAGRSNSRCGRWGSGARRPVPRPAFLLAGRAGPSL